ncbi:MAG: hypothetical protein EOO03_17300, partial [Chitinophagaceae bacterium]
SGHSALVYFNEVPLITPGLDAYIEQKCVPGGTNRNWDSYGEKIGDISAYEKAILADPQTSGGLLVAVRPGAAQQVQDIFRAHGLQDFVKPIGEIIAESASRVIVK